jgi:hypothetical protein
MSAQSNCAARTRPQTKPILVIAAIAASIGASTPSRASDTDSEHLFGFTEGADIGKAGEREAESETIGRFGKAAGSYAAFTQNGQVKMVPIENFRVGVNAAFGYFDMSGVPELRDGRMATLQGISLEARYMLLDRHAAPFGLTVIAEPRWGRIDATSGSSATSFGGTLTVAADKELIDDRLFGALNVLYDPQATRLPIPSAWHYESEIGASAALSARISTALFLGGEIRYLRAYDALGADAFAGQAIFAGPTLYVQISKHVALSAAWNAQLWGRSASGDALDLVHFERQQAKIRINFNF